VIPLVEMRLRLGAILTLLAAAIDCVKGKCDTWQTQVNISMCNWQGLRGMWTSLWLLKIVLMVIANVIRDTLYIDGGQLWFQQYEMVLT